MAGGCLATRLRRLGPAIPGRPDLPNLIFVVLGSRVRTTRLSSVLGVILWVGRTCGRRRCFGVTFVGAGVRVCVRVCRTQVHGLRIRCFCRREPSQTSVYDQSALRIAQYRTRDGSLCSHVHPLSMFLPTNPNGKMEMISQPFSAPGELAILAGGHARTTHTTQRKAYPT